MEMRYLDKRFFKDPKPEENYDNTNMIAATLGCTNGKGGPPCIVWLSVIPMLEGPTRHAFRYDFSKLYFDTDGVFQRASDERVAKFCILPISMVRVEQPRREDPSQRPRFLTLRFAPLIAQGLTFVRDILDTNTTHVNYDNGYMTELPRRGGANYTFHFLKQSDTGVKLMLTFAQKDVNHSFERPEICLELQNKGGFIAMKGLQGDDVWDKDRIEMKLEKGRYVWLALKKGRVGHLKDANVKVPSWIVELEITGRSRENISKEGINVPPPLPRVDEPTITVHGVDDIEPPDVVRAPYTHWLRDR